MMKYDVAVVGEIYIDHIFTGFGNWPKPGEEIFTRQYVREIGGGAANTACALARLGRTVRLFGVIGASDAAWFETRLGVFGVSSDTLEKVDGNTGVTVSLSTRDDRSFFTYVGENEKLTSMLWSEAMLASLRNARHVHFALPLSPELALHLLPALQAAGCTTSLDVGFQTEWLRSAPNLENLPFCGLSVSERERSFPFEQDGCSRLSFLCRQGGLSAAAGEARSSWGGDAFRGSPIRSTFPLGRGRGYHGRGRRL